jgi:murein DD-endopeptidase MepM/ murein hydrolase activator NlpD
MAEVIGARGTVGRQATFGVAARAPGSPGLRSVEIRIRIGDSLTRIFQKAYPPGGLLARGVGEDVVRVDAALAKLGVPEGTGQLEVLVETYGWRPFGGDDARIAALHPVTVDVTPPRLELVSAQHNLRLGGSAIAVFRAPGAERGEVLAGSYAFPAIRGLFADPDAWAGVFAVPQDLDPGTAVSVRAIDAAGNTAEAALHVAVKGRRFPDRTLALSDAFLERKVPEIYTANALTVPGDLVAGYLFINRDLRQRSEERLRELAATSAARPLWDGRFLRQPNAAPMSAFADRRAYEYRGEVIDRQTHLGYDLASLRNADVIATQNGIVVLADNLGIYGNTVVLDHGMGVFSLYGHLSTLAVQKDQQVKAGDVVGQSGETGLAGGDHLHFSIMVSGIHVDPVEWWDPAWIRDHVTAKLSMLPAAATNGQNGSGAKEPPAQDGEPGADPAAKPAAKGTEAWPAGASAAGAAS